MRSFILSFAMLLGVFVLSGCAGGAMTFDRHLRQLEGKPVNDADLMLGHHATGQYRNGDATVYVWQSRDAESVFGSGVTAGRGYRLGSASTALGSEFLWAGVQLHSCVIRATTLDGIIRKISYEGNPGGCETIYGYRKKELGYDASQRP